jgi:hypothetical protein
MGAFFGFMSDAAASKSSPTVEFERSSSAKP